VTERDMCQARSWI